MSNTQQLRAALEASPDNIPLLLLYAQACLDEFSHDDAREAFLRVQALEHGHPDAALGLARMLHLEGKTSEAVIRTEVVAESHPRLAGPRLLLARLLLAEGQKNEWRDRLGLYHC